MDPVLLMNLSFLLNALLLGFILGELSRSVFADGKRAFAAFMLFCFLMSIPISWARNTVKDALIQTQEPADSTQTASTTEEIRQLDEQSINELLLTHSGPTFRL
ncbi:MAG: hypothetical protein HQ488_01785 [Parcubacteria group bacterium]|nr:hypothetical protein [Parcubacteria group bacterium]